MHIYTYLTRLRLPELVFGNLGGGMQAECRAERLGVGAVERHAEAAPPAKRQCARNFVASFFELLCLRPREPLQVQKRGAAEPAVGLERERHHRECQTG